MPRVSAIVIHYGRGEFTTRLAAQLLALGSAPEVIIVDNAAEQPFDAAAFPGLRCLRLEENRGYGHACNRGADAATGEYLFILNNDLEFPDDPLPALLRAMDARPDAGAAGPALRFPDGRFQLSFGEQPTLCTEFLEKRRQEQSRGGGGAQLDARARKARAPLEPHWITGACMLIRRAAWEAVAGFDEAYFFYFEDTDLCTRLRRAGFAVLYRPEAVVVHYGGGSAPLADPRIVVSYRREQLRYYARYNSRVSYALLRHYLLRKFARLARGGGIDRATADTLSRVIRHFNADAERACTRTVSPRASHTMSTMTE
ncbi:MAG: glycosyltransferase family 2 protein [Bacteroidota bacterium]|jgi:GT2 family glycosyltransferase|nr:glycosyltransferase family 2 protein [Bacteroidota bacterium]